MCGFTGFFDTRGSSPIDDAVLRRMGVESTVRPSFSIYNTRDEVDRLIDAVKRIARA